MSESLEIVKLGHAGDGVASDGSFVPYTVPGDVVRVEREGEREVSFQGALGAIFVTMTVGTVAHLFVRWLTGGEHALPNLALGGGLFTAFWGIRRTLGQEDQIGRAHV